MAIHLLIDGTEKEVTPKDGKSFDLDEQQGFVSGYIEHVHLPDHRVMVVNEEGKLQGLGINRKASEMTGLTIVGNVLIGTRKEMGY